MKSKGLHKLYSVSEGIQEPSILSLACKSVVSRPVRGHSITWNSPMMEYLNSFLASGGGNLNKNFPKLQMPGELPGGGGGGMFKLQFDWYIIGDRPREDGKLFFFVVKLFLSVLA